MTIFLRMKRYRINEIFYSLQGEGFFTGVPSIFIRFSGCNLQCPFCDTQHESGIAMTAEEIRQEADKYPTSHIVLTGGEPSLFADSNLMDALKRGSKRFVAMETNGTHPIPDSIDWVTLSPKFDYCGDKARLAITRCDELKVVYVGQDLSVYNGISTKHRFLQPCDYGDNDKNSSNLKETIEACMANPEWRLSLQTHKLLNIR